MSSPEATLYLQLQAEQTRLTNELTKMSNVGSTATSNEKAAIQAELESVTGLLANWTEYTKLRADANTALTTAYTTTNTANSTLKTLTTNANEVNAKLQGDNQTKQKMLEINTYYSKQYEAYKELFIIVSIVALCVVVTLSLEYTPLQFLSRSMTIAVCIIGGAFIISKIINMMLKSTTNYDEYNWVIQSPGTDNGMRTIGVNVDGLDIGKSICVGPLCCGEGTEWNTKQGCSLIRPQEITST